MYAGSSIVFTAHSNNSLAIVDTFNIDTVRMLDTISYPHRGHDMRVFTWTSVNLPFLCPSEAFKGPVLSF